jgi:peptide deformylase
MTVRPTVQLGDPFLRRVAAPVKHSARADLLALEGDLAETLADWKARTTYGRGIAAPQIGVSQRVVFLNFEGSQLLVNPRITAHSETEWEPWDACLSFSVEFFCRVRRWEWVEVSFTDVEGHTHQIHAGGELSELLQHEIDHLDGILATDRMTSPRTLCMRRVFERYHRDESPYRT